MNQKLCKMIRKYAKLRNIEYSECKAVYAGSTPEEKALFREEMLNSQKEVAPPAPYHAVLPININQ